MSDEAHNLLNELVQKQVAATISNPHRYSGNFPPNDLEFLPIPEKSEIYTELYKTGCLGKLIGNKYCLTGNVWEHFPEECDRLKREVTAAKNRKFIAAVGRYYG